MVLYFKRMGEQNVTFMMAILYSKFFVLNCIYNRLASAVEYVDIRLQDGDSTMRILQVIQQIKIFKERAWKS